MKKYLPLIASLAFTLPAAGQKPAYDGSLRFSTDSADIALTWYGPSTLRVQKAPRGVAPQKASPAVIAAPEAVKVKSSESGGTVTLSSPKLTVKVNTADGTLHFLSPSGETLIQEAGGAAFRPYDDAGTSTYSATQSFRLDKDEHVYGLGNHQRDSLTRRGMNIELTPGNIEDGIPVMTSVKGYGLFWDNPSPTVFSDTPGGLTTFSSPVGPAVDYYLMAGGDADGVMAEMRQLTGQVPMLPLWAYGFWQSRERYKTQEELLDVLRRYRSIGVPVDGMIQDWQYWGSNYVWNAMDFLNPGFNDPKGMIREIHDKNAHLIISIWQSFGPQTHQYKELKDKGLLFESISTWPVTGVTDGWTRTDYPSGVKVYNPYSQEARDTYWRYLRPMHELGLDGWWMDSTEPDHFSATKEDMDSPTGMGSYRKVRSLFPFMCVGGVHDNQLQTDSARRVFILTRSGYAGQQRYGANVWTGDVESTWDNLRRQVPAMLNFTLTGNPNTNSDIGGFFARAYNRPDTMAYSNPRYGELMTRWLQMGAFTPMMRSHGTDAPREIYLFGEAGQPVYDALVDAVKLRYRMLPYTYSTAADVTLRNGSFMRALPMDFPDDPLTHDLSDQFMWGRALMAAPVMQALYTAEDPEAPLPADIDFKAPREHKVYLPAGTDWWDVETGTRHSGGQTLTKTVTLASNPLFARAGAIVPWGPDVQFAAEKPWTALDILVFPGADGSFTLYEDAGEGYGYQKGEFTEIPFAWSDGKRTLTIGERRGAYPGMIGERTFRVVLPDGSSRTVTYSGRRATLKF